MMLRRTLLSCVLLVVPAISYAQRTPVPLMDFKGIPTASPGAPQPTTEQVRKAILAGMLAFEWDAKPQADGSIVGSTVKDGEHLVVVNVTFDERQYSVTYVDSKNLRFTPKEPPAAWNPGAPRRFENAAKDQAEKFTSNPETPYAVKTEGYIHPAYEAWVRELISGIRRRLNAPA